MRHRFHAICPYFAMFPESFAESWIKRVTQPGDFVLDPFCGRGTTPLTALLLGRRAIASDVNDVAYCLTRAKTSPPALGALRRRITFLERRFVPEGWGAEAAQCPEFFAHAYTDRVLRQLLYLRSVLKWRANRTDTMVASLTLGALHGESDKSSSYLSNQMPRTISTKPRYSVRFWEDRRLTPPDRDVFSLLRDRADFRYASPVPEGQAIVYNTDMRKLPRHVDAWPAPVKCVITSPPYLDVTRFEEDQWLRLWFLGRAPHPTKGRVSRDDRHRSEGGYWQFMADMWRSLGRVLAPRANVIIRIGGRDLSLEAIRDRLLGVSCLTGRKVQLASASTSRIRKRQTDAFRPGSRGCRFEYDFHFVLSSS